MSALYRQIGASPHKLHVWGQGTHVVFITAAPLGKACTQRRSNAAGIMSALSEQKTAGQDMCLAGTGFYAPALKQQSSAEPPCSEAPKLASF